MSRTVLVIEGEHAGQEFEVDGDKFIVPVLSQPLLYEPGLEIESSRVIRNALYRIELLEAPERTPGCFTKFWLGVPSGAPPSDAAQLIKNLWLCALCKKDQPNAS